MKSTAIATGLLRRPLAMLREALDFRHEQAGGTPMALSLAGRLLARDTGLDLLFTRPARLALAQRAELRSRFEASRPPYWVDVADADPLAPGTLAERVAAECRRL